MTWSFGTLSSVQFYLNSGQLNQFTQPISSRSVWRLLKSPEIQLAIVDLRVANLIMSNHEGFV